jgi:GH15 family glucan-1,4-alpha-glucosidase
MAWVAVDRAIRLVDELGRDGPAHEWRRLRAEIHEEVCREGFDAGRNTFVQTYGSGRLDASLLMIPLVGFLPADDERVVGTVAAIERELMRDGLVERYRADAENEEIDGFPPGEGVFLPCSLWLAGVLALQGRRRDARALFERVLGLQNDLGLLSEQYDTEHKRLVGNFPQALTHLTVVGAALQIAEHEPLRQL